MSGLFHGHAATMQSLRRFSSPLDPAAGQDGRVERVEGQLAGEILGVHGASWRQVGQLGGGLQTGIADRRGQIIDEALALRAQ